MHTKHKKTKLSSLTLSRYTSRLTKKYYEVDSLIEKLRVDFNADMNELAYLEDITQNFLYVPCGVLWSPNFKKVK